MRNIAKKLLLGTVLVACVFSLTACASDDVDKGDNVNTQTVAQQQITRAKQTYNSFYNKDGLFSEQVANGQNEQKAVRAVVTTDENITALQTFDGVRETLSKYYLSNTNTKNIVNSYVADIFAYSQVQTSIIDTFGEEALTDVYALTYDSVDWSSDTTGYSYWINSTRLLSAAFAGTDLETGRVYCTQAHRSANKLVLANLEFYYNSDSDMGVTTINWHSDGSFEYHYCSAGSYEILQAFGRYNDNDEITLNSFTFTQKDGEIRSTLVSVNDAQYVFDYVKSEISRINGKVESLQEQNGRECVLDGTEQEEDVHVGVCSVKLDFLLLSKMIVK